MPDSSSEKPQPPKPPWISPPPEPKRAPAADDTGDYAVVEPAQKDLELALARQPTADGWYMSRLGGPQEGPFDLAEMKRRLLCGELRSGDLVWREGMADWQPAREVRELFAAPASGPQPPPRPGRPAAAAPFQPEKLVRNLNKFCSCPKFFRWTAYVAAALALFWLAESVLLWYWELSWFTGALLFAVIFVVAQGVAAVLEAVARVTPEAEKQDKDHG
jgi:hypothetical protein